MTKAERRAEQDHAVAQDERGGVGGSGPIRPRARPFAARAAASAAASKASRIEAWRAVKRPRFGEHVEARPVAGIVTPAGEESGQRVARLAEFLGRAADRMGAHQRGRSLAERAGAHLLAELGHPALLVQYDIDGHPAAADRRAASRRSPAARSSRR